MEMLCILIVMVVTQLYSFFRTQTMYFKLVNFSVCKLSLETMHFLLKKLNYLPILT